MTKLHFISPIDKKTSCDVIFIHGLGGGPLTTWIADDQPASWLHWLDSDLPHARILSVEYDSAASRWLGSETMPIFDRANNLLTLFRAHGVGSNPIAFIAHSLGGLLVKRLLLNDSGVASKKTILSSTSAVVFLGTPNHGSSFARSFGVLRKLFKLTDLANELEANKVELRELHNWYRDNSTGYNINTITFFETRPTRLGLVVDATSSDPGIPSAPLTGIDADHFSICKPVNNNELVYISVLQALRDTFEVDQSKTNEGGASISELATPRPVFHSDFSYCHDHQYEASLREAELSDLALALQSSNTAILHGLPGVGKTSIIKHFVEQNKDRFSIGVWRVALPDGKEDGSAHQEPTHQEYVQASLFEFLKRLERQGPDLIKKLKISPHELTEFTRPETLEKLVTLGEKALFVFENVPDQETLGWAKRFLKNSKVLISTNSPTWNEIDKHSVIEIRPLADEVGGSYLLDKIKGPRNSLDDAIRLSEALGGLPLALRHAIAFCTGAKCPIANYHKTFAQHLDDKVSIPLSYKAEKRAARTVAATFTIAIDKACGLDDDAKLEDTLTYRTIGRASMLTSLDWITLPLLSETNASVAIRNLRRFSLIDVDETEQNVRVHPLVKLAMRRRMSRQDQEAALNGIIFGIHRCREDASTSSRLIPPIVDVLAWLRTGEFRNSDVRDRTEVIRGLLCKLIASENDLPIVEKVPELFIDAICDIYEVNPLAQILDLFIERVRKRGWQGWETLQDQLLKSNNYVLSFTLAESLATVWKDDRSRLISLLKNSDKINRFELGAFALSNIYAKNPGLLDSDASVVKAIGSDGTYVGKAILGRLFTHLIINKYKDLDQLRSMYGGDEYWKTKWDFVKTTVVEVKAAAVIYGQALDEDVDDEDTKDQIKDEVTRLRCIRRRIDKLLDNGLGPAIKELFSEGGFFLLAVNTRKIDDAYKEFRRLDTPLLVEVMDILFGHPIFNVAETAATKLRDLIVEDENHAAADSIFSQLFAKDHWRSHYGACETAFQLRLTNPNFFENSVSKFYRHPSCRVRGLCAENLISTILAASTDKALMMLGVKKGDGTKSYRYAIDCWLRDDDCWVLDHIYRLFSELSNRTMDRADEMTLRKLASRNTSPLLHAQSDWFKWPRIKFLQTIERNKFR